MNEINGGDNNHDLHNWHIGIILKQSKCHSKTLLCGISGATAHIISDVRAKVPVISWSLVYGAQILRMLRHLPNVSKWNNGTTMMRPLLMYGQLRLLLGYQKDLWNVALCTKTEEMSTKTIQLQHSSTGIHWYTKLQAHDASRSLIAMVLFHDGGSRRPRVGSNAPSLGNTKHHKDVATTWSIHMTQYQIFASVSQHSMSENHGILHGTCRTIRRTEERKKNKTLLGAVFGTWLWDDVFICTSTCLVLREVLRRGSQASCHWWVSHMPRSCIIGMAPSNFSPRISTNIFTKAILHLHGGGLTIPKVFARKRQVPFEVWRRKLQPSGSCETGQPFSSSTFRWHAKLNGTSCTP